MEHGGWRRYGVASPVADKGSLGTVIKQSRTVALSALVAEVVAADEVEVAEAVEVEFFLG